MDSKGYYGQYVYGRIHKILSPRAEALGEALCVLYDIADNEKQQQVVSHTPVTPYGISSIFPQIPNRSLTAPREIKKFNLKNFARLSSDVMEKEFYEVVRFDINL